MPRPGFYNDNEHRAYPFILHADQDDFLPDSLVVDINVIMGLDSEFDPTAHTVWLSEVSRAGNTLTLTLQTNAPGAAEPLMFHRDLTAGQEWETEFVESGPYVKDANSCATEPAWSAFLTTGPLDEISAALPSAGTINPGLIFTVEPAQIQSLVRSYLRGISIGNLSRPAARSACEDNPAEERKVILNKTCLKGDIRFKEGYNAIIRQRDAISELYITAGRGAGDQNTKELCDNYGELPLYEGEQKPILFEATTENPAVYSQFFSGGPACNELVASINGVLGPNVNFVAGTGINILADPGTHTITIEISPTTLAGNC